jgi:hypothetical protein
MSLSLIFYYLGADIIMQLDDVVSSTISGPRVEEAMWRFDFDFSCFYINMIQIFEMA